jgi:hypothetical protein
MNPRIPDTANAKRVGFHVDTLCYSSVDKHASLIKIELSLDRFSQILRGLSRITACGVSTESCCGAGNNLARQVPVPLTGLDRNATLAVTIGEMDMDPGMKTQSISKLYGSVPRRMLRNGCEKENANAPQAGEYCTSSYFVYAELPLFAVKRSAAAARRAMH